MKTILEYLSTKVAQTKIKATNKTIKQIVKAELDRLGHDADLNHIDVSEVTNMKGLFSCRIDFLGEKYNDINPNISKWNVSNVEKMNLMFCFCENFNQDISEWNISNVKEMDFMFDGCTKFNQDISNWNVRKVESMCCMFRDCKNFNQDLYSWDVDNVKDHDYMFYDCPIKEEYKPKFNI